MIRILHVVGGMGLGGTETFLMNVYRSINKGKVQFDFIVYDSNKHNSFYEEEIKKLGGRIYYLPNPTLKKPYKSILEIRKILKETSYNAVHAHTKYNSGLALFTAWLCKVKIRIAHSHNTGGDYSSSILYKVYQKVMFIIINTFGTDFLACSKEAAKHLFTKSNIEKRYSFVPNAVDFNIFFNLSLKESRGFKNTLGISEGDYVVGHVGRYGKAKNHRFIIKMFAALLKKNSNFCLVLIGDGPSRLEIQEMIESLGISSKVRVLGQRNDVPKLMSIMDVFILPSIYEGLGIVLLEAQAMGLPCVVSENIQPEADMGMNLINWINLNNLDNWVDNIIRLKENKIHDKEKIQNVIEHSPYVLNKVVEKFHELYGLDELMSN